jgi:ABC-2 type transport system permease protein
MNLRRVGILVLRYAFVYRRSAIRLVEIWFWPTMELLLWGYVTLFLQRVGEGAVPRLVTFLIGAMILWDVLYRAQQGITLSFLEDVWVRNLLNIFCAPVRLSEYIAATFLFGLARVGVTLLSLAVLAWVLYRFDLFELGYALIPFMANLLILGLALGIITTAIILRFGQAAEALAWAVPFLIQPFAAVFYPVSVLPPVMQALARAIPCTYVFEGMREVLRTGTFRWDHFGWALGLNALYLAFGIGLLVRMFDLARERGLLGRLTLQ